MIKTNHQPELNGFSYFVTDEQLSAYAKLSMLQRLQWVDDARLFTLMTQTPETKARHEALRKGNIQSQVKK
jgi:hypothetical protein